MASIRKLIWLVVYVFSTLCFIVLFEHGPEKFKDNLKKEIEDVRKMAEEQMHPKKENPNGPQITPP